MRHNRNTFFHELTPMANAIRRVTCAPATPIPSFDEQADTDERVMAQAQAKRAAKLARRAARARSAAK